MQIGNFFDRTPQVWGKGYWGFIPEGWGCISFTHLGSRDRFLSEANNGDLVMIYGTNNRETEPDERKRVLGFYEVKLEERATRDCISDEAWTNKNANNSNNWNYAVPAVRAWRAARVGGEFPQMPDIAAETYNNHTYTIMATTPVLLSNADQKRALNVLVEQTSVFGEPFFPDEAKHDSIAPDGLKPSRGVPPFSGPREWVEEEGPKQLYRLRLICDVAALMGWKKRDVADLQIFKVGYSGRPQSRCKHFNNHLPYSASLRWIVEATSDAYPDAKAALDAETFLKENLAKKGNSLGREFFLASENAANQAWELTLMQFPQR